MPRVRIPTAQVGPAPLPTPNPLRRDTSGYEALAGAAGEVAGAAVKYAAVEKKAREEAQAVKLEQLEGDFTGTVNDGLTNSQTGLLSQQGQNASAASVPFYESLDKRRQELLDQVEDPKAKEILAVRLQRLADSARARGEAHVSAENQRADDTSFSVLKDQVKARVGEAALDPKGRAEAIEQLVLPLRSYANRKGLQGDAAALEAQWRGESAEIVTNRLISAGQYGQARAYLADPGVRVVLGDRIARYEASLSQDERQEQGASQARAFVRGATNPETGRFDLAGAKRGLDELLASDVAPEVKKAAQQEFNASASLADTAFNKKIGDVAEDAITRIGNAGYSLRAAKDQLAWLRREDVGAGKVADQVEEHVRSLLRERAGQPATPAQQDAMVDFLVGMKDNLPRYLAEPSAFKTEWLGRLGSEDLKRAASYVGQSGLAAGKTDETLPAMVVQQITAEGQRAGVFPRKPPAKWNPDQKERFRTIADDLLQEQQKAKGQGKALDDATVKARLGYWLAQGDVAGGGILGSNKSATRLQAAVDEDLTGKPFVQQIQERDRDAFDAARPQIDDELRKSGIQPDDDWRRWMFLKAKGVPDAENPRPQAGRPFVSTGAPYAMGAGSAPQAEPAAAGSYAAGSR